ncbi:MAG: cytochrome P450 [Acidobacteriota bacterium]
MMNPVRLFRDPVGFFREMADSQGPLARIKFGPQVFYLLNDPGRIEEALVRKASSFEKFPRIDRTRGLFGEGLLTSEEPLHLRQRRLAQPAFHREKLAGYASEMVEATERLTGGWQEGMTVDAAHEMGVLALDIVSRTLFSTQTNEQTEQISASLNTVIETLNHLVMPWGNLLVGMPTPVRRRYRRALDTLDAIIYGLIEERRRAPGVADDLLGMLMNARDSETGEGMPNLQLRDELMTMFVAGHDTTANALAWTLHLLSLHPEQRELLEREVDWVLGKRPATAEDVGRLPFTSAVFRESLRMYPPVWILGRRALAPVELSGLRLERGAVLLVSMAVLHRRPELFADPERFDPLRPPPEHRFAYLPFGAGARLCIGERFAWMEGVLCLATMAQRWRLEREEGGAVEAQALLTLRPRNGLALTPRRRRRQGGVG